jgi:uncharacterized protein (DUF983 family)
MKQLFDNTEIECYTNPSNVKFYVLGLAVFAGAVFVGWLLNASTWVALFMDIFTDAI